MKKRQNRRPGVLRKLSLFLGIVLLVAALLLTVFDLLIRGGIVDMLTYQAKISAMRCINGAMAEEIKAEGLAYRDIVNISSAETGIVSSVQMDMIAVNNLKVNVAGKIMDELGKQENRQFSIPLGSLIGNHLTTGRGPDIVVRVQPVGYAQTQVYSQFTAAGINQTLHKIIIETGIQMLVIIPGMSIKTEAVTNYCIAQTVIVGSVPEGYTEINGDEAPLISKFNDYRQDY